MENKKSNLNASQISNDLTRARDDIEQLFYAVQLLVRGLRPLRVRVRDLQSQKQFLTRQLSIVEISNKELRDAILSIASVPKPVPRKNTSFRSISIFSIF